MKKFLSLIVLVIAVAFTSQAENGAGNDNGVTYEVSFDLPVVAAVVDNAAPTTVTPFSNVAVVTVNNKNVGGFDVEVPSNSVFAIENATVNDSSITDGNKGFAETVSDTSTDNGVDEYANTVKDNGIEFETDEVFKYPIYPEYLANSTNNVKYTNERIKTNVGKLLENI